MGTLPDLALSVTVARPPPSSAEPRWIGPPIPAHAVSIIMGISMLSSLISATQPLLFGALAHQGRLTAAQIGLAGTLELGATGIATVIATANLKPDPLRPVVASAALIYALANITTAYASGAGILVARTVAGCCEGIFMWQLIGMFARCVTPTRLNGIYLAVQGAVGFSIAAVAANWIIPRFGVSACYFGLGGAGLLAAFACYGLPKRYAPLIGGQHAGMKPNGPGFVALASIFIVLAGIIAAWIYVPPLAAQHGYPAWVVGLGTPLTLGMEIVGGVTVAALAPHLSYRLALLGVIASFSATVLLFIVGFSPILFVTGLGMFGFFWMFILPLHYPYAIAVDPSRRTMVYVGSAQLLGLGAGPMLASLAVTNADVRGAMFIALGLFATSVTLLLVSLRMKVQLA